MAGAGSQIITSVKKLEAIKEPGRYRAGEGLYLEVGRTAASRSWILRVTVQGKRRDIGLGGYPAVGLAEARDRANEMRKIARRGEDPVAAKSPAEPPLSFEMVARTVYEGLLQKWKPGGVHVKHWIASLERHVFPKIGEIPIDCVSSQDIAPVLQAIWFERPETARRVRQRLRVIMAWAKANGKFEGENPVDIASGGLPNNRSEVPNHHPALPYDDLPGVMRALAMQDSVSALALRFIILTTVRSGEGRGARWGEIDFDERIWTVPKARMKTRRDHRVPLSAAALAILEEARGLDDDLIFPGQRSGNPLTDVAVTKALRRTGRSDCSVHGMRSTFRDWSWEKTNIPREVAELCLAHQVGNAVERAYARSDLLDRRRDLMERWGGFCTNDAGKIVELRA